MFFVAIIWCILISNGKAYTVNCSSTECQSSFINCPPRENCFVSCADTLSCLNSVINCPVTGDCHIECRGTTSCQNVLIDATLLSGALHVFCNGINDDEDDDDDNDDFKNTTDHCKGMKIYGNTLQSNDGTFNVECSGALRSCINADFSCPLNGECNILCAGRASCEHAVITGPIHNDLRIACDGERACFGAILNGAHAATLTIAGCTKLKSCFDLTLYCPPHIYGTKRCFIEGNDNLGRDISSTAPTKHPTQAPTLHPIIHTNKPLIPSITQISGNGIVIYAVNGWNDVMVNYTGTFGVTHNGMMICGNNYDNACNLAAHDWSCEESNEYCNNNNMYGIQSVDPTRSPIDAISTRVTQLPSLSTMDHDDSNNEHHIQTKTVSNSSVNGAISYAKSVKGDVFILSGICAMIATCICVGCARFRKSITDAQEAERKGKSGAQVVPSLEYNSRHSAMSASRQQSISRKNSVSRSHHSSSRRSMYDAANHDANAHDALC